jgi:O-antigen/teichoic acid export membrane protein
MGRVSASIAFILVARILGPAESGTYALGIAFAAVGSAVTLWGLDQVLVRDVASDRKRAVQYIPNFLLVRAILTALIFLLIALVVRWPFAYDHHTSTVILLMSLSILPEGLDDVWQSLFVAYERIGIPAITSIATGVGRLIATFAILKLGGAVEIVALVMVITSFLRLGIDTWLGLCHLDSRLGPLSLRFCSAQLREAFPFLFAGVCIVIRGQGDTILLSLLLSEHDVGLYRGALTIVTAAILIPQAFRVAALPTMSRLHRESHDAFEQMYQRSMFYLFLVALPMVITLFMLAEPILVWLYGTAFAPAAGALRVLSLGLLFEFLLVPNMRALIVTHRQQIAARAQGLGTLVAIILTVVLVQTARIVGSAAARVIAAAVLFFSSHRYVSEHISYFVLLNHAWRPLLSVALVAIVFFLIGSRLPVIITVALGGILYLGGLFLFHALPQEDWRRFRKLFHATTK